MGAMTVTGYTDIYCGRYESAKMKADELVALAEEKGTMPWKAWGLLEQGWLLLLTGKDADAVQTITSSITALRSTGGTVTLPWYLSILARAYFDKVTLRSGARLPNLFCRQFGS